MTKTADDSNSNSNSNSDILFTDFELNPQILKALEKVGYSKPSPIQAQIIPYLCQGRDVIGQAQTGTGKTAAFALPILSSLNTTKYSDNPQVLVLAPTRELAIQVSDSFSKYSMTMDNVRITTICGGQEYRPQLRSLKHGVDIVVGTPGRIIDHIKRGSLDLSNINTFVLDEADEMLKMGFIEDIDWILEQANNKTQIALFSATMPKPIKKIAIKYLNDPVKITIEPKSETSSLISQYHLQVNYSEKVNTLVKILDIHQYDNIDGVIVFVRTKMETSVVAEQLLAHGFKAVALNGDIDQKQRERTIKDLKDGKIDILIATDVAARGLDVERITHVVNYDMPHDTETYMHRIGRTGRAGKSGVALSFVTKSERGRLRDIERHIKADVERFQMPKLEDINDKRVELFEAKLLKVLAKSQKKGALSGELQRLQDIINHIGETHSLSTMEIAAAVIKLLYNKTPLLLTKQDIEIQKPIADKPFKRREFNGDRGRNRSRDRDRDRDRSKGRDRDRDRKKTGHKKQRTEGKLKLVSGSRNKSSKNK